MNHWVERINDFHILILREGVLPLIRGSPLQESMSRRAGDGVLALIAYYVLSGFCFDGDESKRYIRAVRKGRGEGILLGKCMCCALEPSAEQRGNSDQLPPCPRRCNTASWRQRGLPPPPASHRQRDPAAQERP